MSTEIIKTESEQFELTQRQAKLYLASGFFKGVKDQAQACVKMEVARSLNLNPLQGLMGVHFVQDRLCLEASLMAAVAKRNGGYSFRAIKHDDTIAHIAILDAKGNKLGESSFSMEDARNAGLSTKDNWRKYPRNMLWARAMANACRWYCSDAFGGPVYVPEEMGADALEVQATPIQIEPIESIEARTEAEQEQFDPAVEGTHEAVTEEIPGVKKVNGNARKPIAKDPLEHAIETKGCSVNGARLKDLGAATLMRLNKDKAMQARLCDIDKVMIAAAVEQLENGDR